MGPVLLSALEGAGWGLEKSGSVPGGTGSTQSGGKRKTRKRKNKRKRTRKVKRRIKKRIKKRKKKRSKKNY